MVIRVCIVNLLQRMTPESMCTLFLWIASSLSIPPFLLILIIFILSLILYPPPSLPSKPLPNTLVLYLFVAAFSYALAFLALILTPSNLSPLIFTFVSTTLSVYPSNSTSITSLSVLALIIITFANGRAYWETVSSIILIATFSFLANAAFRIRKLILSKYSEFLVMVSSSSSQLNLAFFIG